MSHSTELMPLETLDSHLRRLLPFLRHRRLTVGQFVDLKNLRARAQLPELDRIIEGAKIILEVTEDQECIIVHHEIFVELDECTQLIFELLVLSNISRGWLQYAYDWYDLDKQVADYFEQNMRSQADDHP